MTQPTAADAPPAVGNMLKYSASQPRGRGGRWSGGHGGGHSGIDADAHWAALKPTKAESDAVKSYTSNMYISINGGLRGKIPVSPKAQESINGLDSLMKRSRLPNDTYVYRGLSGDTSKLGSLKVGGVLKDAGFASTTTDPAHSAVSQGKVVMKVHAAPGTRAVPIGSKVSRTGNEAEVLFDRGTSFRIRGKRKLDDGRTELDVEAVQ